MSDLATSRPRSATVLKTRLLDAHSDEFAAALAWAAEDPSLEAAAVRITAARRRFAFIGHPRLPGRCLLLGIVMALAGLGTNVVLFARWMSGDGTPSGRGHALASLSQALIILGATLACFGVISRFLTRSRAD